MATAKKARTVARGGGAKKRARAAATIAAGASSTAKTAPRAARKADKKVTKKAEKVTKKAEKADRKAKKQGGKKRKGGGKRKRVLGDPSLFAPLTEGERADALRVLTEDKRVAQLAKVGRYRVISTEPLTVKTNIAAAGRRLARLVIYDYASDRSVDACVDLDGSQVLSLRFSRDQPMLSRDEEAAAISIALDDDRVKRELSLGDEALVAMHYWSDRDTELAYTRRSAAVLFGNVGARPSVVAVVDLLDARVTDVVPADQW